MSGAGSSASDDLRLDVLRALAASADGTISDTLAYAAARGVVHTALVGALSSLVAKSMVATAPATRERLVLTEEALGYAKSGSPEFQVWSSIPAGATATGESRGRGCPWLWCGCCAPCTGLGPPRLGLLAWPLVFLDKRGVVVLIACAEEAMKGALGEAAFKVGKNACMKNSWIAFDKATKLYSRKVSSAGFMLELYCASVVRRTSTALARGGGPLCAW